MEKQKVLAYSNMGDFVSCTWCESVMIVPFGADKCPNCYYEGALSWHDDNNKEVNLSDIKDDYIIEYKSYPEAEEYLSDEVLIEEFEMEPNQNYKNINQK